MLRRVLACTLLLAGCGIQERADFLIGRVCDPEIPSACDSGQRCLPHMVDEERFFDYRCRDEASFERVDGVEPPLAYCDTEGSLECPGLLVCRPDRIRSGADGGFVVRRLVCQSPDSPFGPPDEETGT